MNSAQEPFTPLNRRILIIDDNPAIHQDFRKILCPAEAQLERELDEEESSIFGDAPGADRDFQFQIDSAFQGQEGLEMVRAAELAGRPYSVAFVDVRMPPGWDGIETIRHIWKEFSDLQIVICTAYSDYSWAEISKTVGNNDRVLVLKKPFDNIEVMQIAHALCKKWQLTQVAIRKMADLNELVKERTAELSKANERLVAEIAERSAAQEGLRNSEECFSKAFHASPIPMAIHMVAEGRFTDVNEAFERMTGFSRKELIARTVWELRLCVEFDMLALPQLRAHGQVRNMECEVTAKGGELRQALVSLEHFSLGGQPHVLMIAEDLTERRKLEGELRQAQKMEAVGQLAAGVAHDFNNMLTVIQGHASLQLDLTEQGSDIAQSLKQIAFAADRAAKMTRQLLAFSRKQVIKRRRLDLNGLLRQISTVLPQLIGEHIRLVADLAPDLPAVFADECNMEQIILNLAANARDAMPAGGTLTLRTEEVSVDDDYLLRVPDASTGRYICLCVRDTGIGMDSKTRDRIFEPFFTTKEIGKGTGMGLATVYGIVKQHEGWLEVESEDGKGSIFKIYIPVSISAEDAESPRKPLSPLAVDSERLVLVVEDEPAVRNLVKEILESINYRVIEAEDGDQALALARQYGDEIDLLLTDMVMPHGVSGRELAARLLEEHPDLKVIYTSGYSPELFESGLALLEGVNYLPKPYGPSMLAEILRGALEANGTGLQAQLAS